MKTRRRALQTAAAAAAVFPILSAQPHKHAAQTATRAAKPYRAKWLTAAEMKLLAEACDLILPETDTPGAAAARVHEHIDFLLQTDRARQKQVRDCLQWLAKAKPADRVALLTAASENLDSAESRHFTLLKDLTIDTYYQSREGLAQELGWNGNTYLPEFKGCTHPEHQG